MKRPLVIHGASGHASVVADAVRLAGEYEIVGFLDDLKPERRGEELAGATVLGGSERLAELSASGVRHVIVAVGDCAARVALAARDRALGFEPATAIHPRAIVAASARVGAGTVIAAGVVVNPGARIGENAIVNTSASIDHDCVLEDGVHVGPGARLGGGVLVGREAWIGIGATVIDRVRVGARSIVGAGAVVVRDVPDSVVAYGVPARVVRPR